MYKILRSCLIKQAYPNNLGCFVVSHLPVTAILVALQLELGYHHLAILEDLALDWVFVLDMVSAVEGPLVFDVFDGVVVLLAWTASLRKGVQISSLLGNV